MTLPLNGLSLKRYTFPDDTLNTPPRKQIRTTISPSLHPSPTSTNEDLLNEGSLGFTSPPRTSELILYASRSIEEADNTSISPARSSSSLILINFRKRYFDALVELKEPDFEIADEVVNAFQSILRDHFPYFRGLENTPFGLRTGEMKFSRLDSTARSAVQIHFVGGNHWLCSALLDKSVFFFDSLYHISHVDQLSEDLKCIYEGFVGNHQTIIVAPVQQQNASTVCGFFAMANASCVTYGFRPDLATLDQQELREYAKECFKQSFAIDPRQYLKRVRVNFKRCEQKEVEL